MRFKTALSIGCVSALLAAPAMAGVFTIANPGESDSFNFAITINNNDGTDLTKIIFDLSTTTSNAAGSPPLIIDPPAFNESGPPGGTAIYFTGANNLSFGYDFTGFNTGESFAFSWDPDIAGNPGYGATLIEADGMGVQVFTAFGDASGTMLFGATSVEGRPGLFATIESPTNGQVPEPATLALLGLGLAGLGLSRRRKLG